MKKRSMLACAMAAMLLTCITPDFTANAENHTTYNDESGIVFFVYSDRAVAQYTWKNQDIYNIPAEIEGMPVTEVNVKFEDTDVVSVSIPCSVQTIGEDVFKYCRSLEKVTLSEGLKSISDSAFYECDSLLNITIPGTVSDIGSQAFYNCSALKTVEFAKGDGCVIGEKAFYNCDALHTVTMEDGVTEIGNNSFSGCNNLINLSLPETLHTINSSFQGCSKLKTVDLPDSLKNLNRYAFLSCPIYTEQIDVLKYVDDWVIECNTDVVKTSIKEGTRGIAHGAFSECSSLTSLTIPEGVEIIDSSAFVGCTKLIEIKLPSTIKEISTNAFNQCNNIRSMTVPESTKIIAKQSFAGMDNLEEVIILSKDCSIYPDADTIPTASNYSDVTIKGYTGSTAHNYADTFGRTFVALDDESTSPTEPEETTKPGEPIYIYVMRPDVNSDGSIDSSDASIILAYYAYTSTGGTLNFEDYMKDTK